VAALGGSSVGPALTGRGKFVSAAAEYCQLYERASEVDAERFLVGLERVLPRLLATGLEPAGGTMLSDDLSDIYADLKEGFRLLEAGRPEVEADFVWYQGYWSHWGYHCASAIGVVHHYVALYFGPL
jgi:hypothetical protein